MIIQVALEVKTNHSGLAKARPTLGESTAENPWFLWIGQEDAYATQVGRNLFTVTVAGDYGEIDLDQPFEAFALPDVPDHMVKLVGEGSSAPANSLAGSLSIKVVDRFGNPISNLTVSFEALPALSKNPDNPLPENSRNIEFYQSETCPPAFPLWGDCPSTAVFSTVSGHFGALADTFLGNTVENDYTDKVSAAGIEPVQFNLWSLGHLTPGGYAAMEVVIGHLEPVNEKGEKINAAKAGEPLGVPLTAALYLLYQEYSKVGPTTCSKKAPDGSTYVTDCWRIEGKNLIHYKCRVNVGSDLAM